MKNLIVYYSFTLNNEKLACHLKEKMSCEIVKLETVKKRTMFSIMLDMMFSRRPAIKYPPIEVSAYDSIIFVAPIWGGKVAMPLKTFLLNERLNIKAYSFATLCGGTENQKEKIQNELTGIVGFPPSHVAELWISKLVPQDKKNEIMNFRISPEDFSKFRKDLEPLLENKVDLVEA